MIYLLFGYVIVLLIPLFMASWRFAIGAFALQSLLTGFILIGGEKIETWSSIIQAVDLFFIRGLLIPWLFIRLFKKFKSDEAFFTLPANLVIWMIALVLVVVSFWFGTQVFPSDFSTAVHLGTASTGLALAFFILANQSLPLVQVIALLTLEAGIILMEVLAAHHEHWFVQFCLSAVFVWSMAVVIKFVQYFLKQETAQAETLPLEDQEVL